MVIRVKQGNKVRVMERMKGARARTHSSKILSSYFKWNKKIKVDSEKRKGKFHKTKNLGRLCFKFENNHNN